MSDILTATCNNFFGKNCIASCKDKLPPYILWITARPPVRKHKLLRTNQEDYFSSLNCRGGNNLGDIASYDTDPIEFSY